MMFRRTAISAFFLFVGVLFLSAESDGFAGRLQLSYSIPEEGGLLVRKSMRFVYTPDGTQIIQLEMGSQFMPGSPDFIIIYSAEGGQKVKSIKFWDEYPQWSRDVLAVDGTGTFAAISEIWVGDQCLIIVLQSDDILHELKIPDYKSADITSVGFVPAGSLLAVGTRGDTSGSLHLWDAESGALVETLSVRVDGMAIHPEGRWIVTYGPNGVQRISPKAPFSSVPLKAQGPAVFSPDGKLFASRSPADKDTVLVWDTGSWTVAASVLAVGDWQTAAFSPDSRILAAGGDNIQIWDLESEKIQRVLTDLEAVTHVAFSPDGSQLAASNALEIKVWTAGSAPKEVRFVFDAVNKNPHIYPPLPMATSAYPKDRWGDYSASSAFDGNIATAWVEAADGSGTGERIAFFIPEGTAGLSILPGFGKENVFRVNNRLREARLSVYEVAVAETGMGGASLELHRTVASQLLEFEDAMELQDHDLGILLKRKEPDNRFLGVLEIVSVYAGRDPDTSVSEIRFYKKPKEPEWQIRLELPVYYDPVYSDGVLYVTMENLVQAFEAASGKKLWEHWASADGIAPIYIEGGRAYVVGPAGKISVLDAKSGKKLDQKDFRWQWKIPPLVSGGVLCALGTNDRPYAVDLSSGELLWQNPEIYDYERTDGFVAAEGVLCVTGVYKEEIHLLGGIAAIDIGTGNVLWQNNVSFADNVLADAEGEYLCTGETSGGTIYNGVLRCWHVMTESLLALESVCICELKDIAAGGSIVAIENRAYRISDGEELWSFPHGLTSDLYGSGGTVFYTDEEGMLTAADEETGQEKWAVGIGGPMEYAVVGEDTLFLISDRNCYAFRVSLP